MGWKPFIIDNLYLISNIPFVNKYHLRGTSLTKGKKTMIKNTFNCQGTSNKIVFEGKGVVQRCTFYIQGNNNTIIIKEGTNLTEVECWLQYDNNTIIIDENSNLCGKTHLACIEGTNIKIGKNCLFSSDIVFRTGDSHSVLDSEGKRINYSKDITIDDHVWIGYGSKINKGVHLSTDTIVATGAVVTKSFEEKVAIGGNPAKVIRKDVTWDEHLI